MGFDSPKSLGPYESGGLTAAPLVRAVFDLLPEQYLVSDYKVPQNLTIMKIDPVSGLPSKNGIEEFFKKN